MEKRKPPGYWDYNKCKEEALKCKNKYELKLKLEFCYKTCLKNKWIDEFFPIKEDGKKPNGYWTKERCHKEALNYTNRNEFKKNASRAYSITCRNKWLNEICEHMPKNEIKYKWTKEKCHKEALLYSTRKSFSLGSQSAYSTSKREKWLNEICSHMIIVGNLKKRLIYCYEFSDNHVYVGLTYNIDERNKQHMTKKKSPVYKHMIKNNIKPILKYGNYIPEIDAIKLEDETANFYLKNGWNLLNKAKTGSLGGNYRKWCFESIKNIAKQFISKQEFAKKEPKVFNAAFKKGFLKTLFP